MNALFAVMLVLAATHNDPYYKKLPPTATVEMYVDTPSGITGDAVITFHHLPKGTKLECAVMGDVGNVFRCWWERPNR